MNFGIRDINPHWGRNTHQRPTGELLVTDNKPFECRDTVPMSKTGIVGGSGCRYSPAKKGMPPTETGCFVCPIPNPEMCRWNAPAQWNVKKYFERCP